MSVKWIERMGRVDRHHAGTVGMIGKLPGSELVTILKRAVADQCGIDAAVCREVDVLEEDSPECGRDFVAGSVNLHFNGAGAGHEGQREEGEQDQGGATFHKVRSFSGHRGV